MTPDKLAVARELDVGGDHTVAAMAKIVGVSRASCTGTCLLQPATTPKALAKAA